jgi:lysophospholipase L1-like esterase
MENLNKINKAISELADGEMIRYIDANDHFADEEGYLPSWRSSDGCHFDIAGYREWSQWILDNASTLNISFG